MSLDSLQVGFIGLGAMGLPMARNLLQAGVKLKVYNRTRSKAEELASLGAEIVDTPAAVCTPDGIAIAMVSNDDALREIVLGENGIGNALGKGGVHLSMSTIAPQTASELADYHQQRGAFYVAAPVSGRPEAAAAKQLLMWLSGDASAKERVAPLLTAMGRGNFDLGDDPALGHVAKVAVNVLVINAIEVLAEMFAFTEKNGLDPKVFADAITESFFAAPVYKIYGNLLSRGQLPDPGFKLSLALKDMNLALNIGNSSATPLPLVSALRDRLLAGVAKGRGDLDITVLQQSIREDAGLPAVRSQADK